LASADGRDDGRQTAHFRQMSRRKKILLAALAAFAIAAGVLALWLVNGRTSPIPAPDPSRERYNVVVVSIDTLRADRLGCYGYLEHPTSPTIDAIAREGVLFESYIASAPWTTPSHLSLFTSLYPSSHGVMMSFREMWSGLKFGEKSFHKLPDSRLTLAEVLAERGLATAAFTGGGPLDPTIGFGQGFDVYETEMFKLDDGNVGEMTSWIGDHADEQFFLFWHHFEVHAPYLQPDFIDDVAPLEHASQIAEGMRQLAGTRLRSVWPGDPARLRSKQTALLREHDAFNRDVCEALYTGGVRSADTWLGRLVDALRREGLYDRTMIVVTSDHGEEFGEHDRKLWYNKHGHNLYEEMIHLPLVIKLPNGYAGGTRVATVAQTVDVMPTILDVLGVTPSKNEMQGRSLAPLWSRPAPAGDGVAFTESTVSRSEKKSVRSSRYKYIVDIDKQVVAQIGRRNLPVGALSAELYDLKRDPHERHDLLAGKASAKLLAIAADFERQLRRHLSAQRGEATATTLDAAALEKLKALGYIGDAPADAGAPDAGR
jgi:arylsulfatase A-like enzyme